MADYWFSADHHFGHTNIIKHCDRPFQNTEEMDDVLIQRWNAFVARNDVVVYLGDFRMGGRYDDVINFAKVSLNGSIVFVKGNHDGWFKKEKRYMYNKKVKGLMCWCGHYPLRSWPNGVNLHGHSHGTLIDKWPNQFDVGVDVWGYRPVHIEELKAKVDPDLLTRKQRGELG